MKAIKLPSLFFYTTLFFLFIQKNYCQESVDSLQYYYKITINPKSNNDLLKSLAFFYNYKEKSLIKNDSLSVVYAFRTIAIIQNKIGALNDSENSAVEALKIIDSLKVHDSIKREPRLGLNNHLGQICKELERYDRAIRYYKNARKDARIIEEHKALDNNIANIYFREEKYNLSVDYYKRAYEKSISLKDTLSIARTLSNLGLAQSKINQSEALDNLRLSLDLRRKINNTNGVFTSYMHLLEYYRDRNDIEKTNLYGKKAKRIADDTNNAKLRINVLSALIDLRIDPIVAEYKKLNDSFARIKRLIKNEDSSYKYDLGKLESKNIKSEVKRKKEESLKRFFQYLIIFIVILSIFFYYFQKSKNKKKTLQAVYKTENDISKKVHDEVANDVFQVMTTLQSNTNVNEKVIDDLDNIYIKTRNIAKEHSVLDYEGDFKTTLNDLLLSYNVNGVNVAIRDIGKVDWETISKLKKETIYKVLQELMVNMVKHSEAGVVVLNFKPQRKKIHITYSDDGIGASLKKNTGLQNMENRIQSINGTITFDSKINKGFKAKIMV